MEDTEIVSAMQVGITGIFMPVIYTGDSIWEQNGARLVQTDIADFGFADGQRYAFLEGEEGLLFDRDSYPSIAAATTLDEVEAFIQDKIKK